jgi:hypothetical protein
MASEKNIQALCLLKLSELGALAWRQNVGVGWAGYAAKTPTGCVFISDPRPLHAGLCVGSSDIIGITPVVITADMVGRTMGIFTAIEAKSARGRATAEQTRFIAAVRRKGAIAGIAKEHDEVQRLILEFTERIEL